MAKTRSANQLQQESLGRKDEKATASISDLLNIDSTSESSSGEFDTECKFFAGVYTDEKQIQNTLMGISENFQTNMQLCEEIWQSTATPTKTSD